MKRSWMPALMIIAFVTFSLSMALISGEEKEMPFGGEKDVQFAKAIWTAMKGYDRWPMKSGFYPGTSPHGKVLKLYYNMVNVNNKPYHVIIKDNYGGEGATVEAVAEAPEKYLAAVTVMVQREDGYDPAHNNWFWAKYMPGGSLDKNAKGMQMAGRVAKGMKVGCIACHADAADNDFVFTND